MDDKAIREYIAERDEIESATIIQKFGLSYSQAKKLIGELTESGALRYKSGVTYSVNHEILSSGKPPVEVSSKEEALFLKALWQCVASGDVSISAMQRRLNIGFSVAVRLLEKMEECGYVSEAPDRSVLMTVDEYLKKFGKQEWVTEPIMVDFDDCTDIFDDDCEDNEDEESDDDCEDDDDDDDDDGLDFCELLAQAFSESVGGESDTEKYILGADGLPCFSLKLINGGADLKISDCGKTVSSVGKSRTKIKNALKTFNGLELVGDEIVVTINKQYNTLFAIMTLYAAIEYIKRF